MIYLFTIGYEHHTPTTFIDKLRRNGISMLIDVREIPISRKKGFSKNALMEMLLENGIGYTHIKRLGSPSALRHGLYRNGHYDEFFLEYACYLQGENEALEELIKLSRTFRSCIMCVEQMPEVCHRHVIAEVVKQRLGQEVQVRHI